MNVKIPLNFFYKSAKTLLSPWKAKFTLSDKQRAILTKRNNQVFMHNSSLDSISIKYDKLKIEETKLDAINILKKQGIVVIHGLIESDIAKKAGYEFKDFLDNSTVKDLYTRDYIESDHYLSQVGLSKLKNLSEIYAYPKPVFILRSRDENSDDSGMIDIFNFNKLVHNFVNQMNCYSQIRSTWIQEIIESITDCTEKQLNIYYNQSVSSTRSLHIDDSHHSLKVFVYLTDCYSEDYGPYSYIPGSGLKNTALYRILFQNFFYHNISDTTVPISHDLAIPILGPAGTIIISDQTGIHGGIPQKQGLERIMMVNNYNLL